MKDRKFIVKLLILLLSFSLLFSCNNTNNSYKNSSDNNNNNTEEHILSSVTNDDISTESEIESFEDKSSIPEDSIVTFIACPDNLIHPTIYYDGLERAAKYNGIEPIYKDLHNADYNFDHIYEEVADKIAAADIAYINQESLIGGGAKAVSGYPCFNTPNAMGQKVVDLGFDIVNVAHNHSLDSNDTRFLEHCNSFFTERNLNVLGYYPNEESTNDILIIKKNGIKIAFLTYTYGTNGIEVPNNSEFVIPYFDDELINKQVAIAKQEADIIIASCHWGYENTYNVNNTQKYYAKFFCDLGVDVVLGMHPHCVQPMEWMESKEGKKTLVIYSLGNFLSGMQAAMNSLGGMLYLEIVKDSETGSFTIESPTFIPVVTHYVRATPVNKYDRGFRDFKICYLKNYTEEMATAHGVHKYEEINGTTLIGGDFSLDTLWQTIKQNIDAEFLDTD